MPGVLNQAGDLYRLSLRIELLRRAMERAGEQLGLLHPKVLKLSQRLDKLIVEFYRLDA